MVSDPSTALLAEPSKQGTRMALALLASAAVHGMLLSTQFAQINPRLFEDLNLPMEVVLVNARTTEAPLSPDALAQVNLAGGGNTDEERRLKSPLPASPRTEVGSEEAAMQARVAELEKQARTLLSQLQPDAAVPTQVEAAPPAPTRPAPDATQLNQQAREMAQLQARISQQWDEYQQRPKRAFVGANVREYAFARYVEDWVAKVERVGNVNYPEAARRQGIYGSLKLTVSIFANGRIEKSRNRPQFRVENPRCRSGQDRRTCRALRGIPRRHAEKSRHFVYNADLDFHPLGPAGGNRLIGAIVAGV
jgi:periplasmic protein TonB